MWAKHSPPLYSQDLPLLHTSRLSHTLLQIGLYYKDLDGEYRGEVEGEMEEENEGEGVSVE